MKRLSGLGSEMVRLRSVFRIRPPGNGVGGKPETGDGDALRPRYHIEEEELQEIHKAAFRGNVPEVQRLLSLYPELLNDKDWRNRTALHLASACGHPEVVTHLAERKCEMNWSDNQYRTALMKAVQYQEEECATILLNHGADPCMIDTYGNTALHYAAQGKNIAIAEKLLLHGADLEARNENSLTPLLVALSKNRLEMVEFLVNHNADIHAVDKWKRTTLMFAVRDKSSKTVRLLLKRGVDVFARDCREWTAEEHAVLRGVQANIILISDCKQERRCKESSETNNLALQGSSKEESREAHLMTVDEFSETDPVSRLSWQSSSADSWSISDDGNFDVDTKKKATKPSMEKKGNRADIMKSAPQLQTNNDNLTCVDGAQQNASSVKMSALGLGEEEDVESPWDSESIQSSVEMAHPDPNQAIGVNDAQTTTSDLHLGMASDEEAERPDKSGNNYTHVVQKQNGTRKPLSRGQDDRLLQDAILTNCISKQEEAEINLKKMTSEVSENHEKEKELLHGNDILQGETATRRLERDRVKTQNQHMEQQYFEDTAIVKENKNYLPMRIKLKVETMTETVFEYNGQFNVPSAENTMLNSQLENERQSQERQQREAEFYHFMLAHPEIPFPGTRDECFRFLDKMRFDICNLKKMNAILAQKLSKAEKKCNSLEIELRHTKDAVREHTLISKRVQEDVRQMLCRRKERKQGNINMYIGKLESLEEKVSHLESETRLLRQRVDLASNQSDDEENTEANIQELLKQIIKILQAETEKQYRVMEQREEIANGFNDLKEIIYLQEKNEAEWKVVLKKFQQELSDALGKPLLSEASLEVTPRNRVNLESETQGLKALERTRSQDPQKLYKITGEIKEAAADLESVSRRR